MKNELKVILAVLVFLLLIASGLTAQGFNVSGGRLYDANGNEFIIRGVAHPHAWYLNNVSSLADIASVGANAIRVVCSSGDRWGETTDSQLTEIIEVSKGHRIIPILEVHDTTGYGEEGAAATLAQAVSYWQRHQGVLSGEESYVIINIGNEPYGNNNTASWVNDTRSAIQSMRNAGFSHTLIVDAPNWGQDWSFTMRDNAQSIYDADPDGNTILSIHMYGVFDTAAEIQDYIDTIRGMGLPLLVGEFGHNHSDGNPDEDTIMSYTNQMGIGWIAWSWSGNSDDVSYLDMVNDFDVNSRTSWGDRVISGTNGLSSSSSLCSVYAGATIPPITPTPSPIPTPDNNLAMNQPVQASSSESGELRPENAVDGDQYTRWGSSYNTNNWIWVDLGSTVDITRVIIFWEAAYAIRYRLEVSDDANNWTQIYEENSGNGGIDDITVSGTGRYLRMYGVERFNSEWGYSIYELAVFGTGGATATPTPESPTPTPTPEITPDPTGILGDVDENGIVNIVDALLVAQFYVGLDVTINESLADVSCNGTVEIVDALLIAQYYVGIITEEFSC